MVLLMPIKYMWIMTGVIGSRCSGPMAETTGIRTLVTIHFANKSTRFMRLLGEKLVMFH
jgi:hypothetical protein